MSPLTQSDTDLLFTYGNYYLHMEPTFLHGAGALGIAHMEIILFVLGGIFLIFLIDLLVKQGTQASLFLAAAGGARLSGGGLLRHVLKRHT